LLPNSKRFCISLAVSVAIAGALQAARQRLRDRRLRELAAPCRAGLFALVNESRPPDNWWRSEDGFRMILTENLNLSCTRCAMVGLPGGSLELLLAVLCCLPGDSAG